jgi:hemin uptake protein HemP
MDKTEMPNLTKQPPGEVMDALSPGVRVFQATELFGPSKEIGIRHDGALYRLRVTRAGKLILTK